MYLLSDTLDCKLFCFANLIPFSVNRDGSNLRTLPSKNDLLISGSRSGSSPISCKPKTMKYVKREYEICQPQFKYELFHIYFTENVFMRK